MSCIGLRDSGNRISTNRDLLFPPSEITPLFWGTCRWYSLKCNLLCPISDHSQIIAKFTSTLLANIVNGGNKPALVYLPVLLGCKSRRHLLLTSEGALPSLQSAILFFPPSAYFSSPVLHSSYMLTNAVCEDPLSALKWVPGLGRVK